MKVMLQRVKHLTPQKKFKMILILTLTAKFLNQSIGSVSTTTSDASNANDVEASSDTPTLSMANTNMLDILLKSIGDCTINDANLDQDGTANSQCENELYQQLLLGNDFTMKMQNIETTYNCPLSWWKSSAH